MLQFNKLVKPVAFDNKETCAQESIRPINDSRFNSDKPALTIITLKTKKELEEHLYPRVEYFHKHQSTKKHKLTSTNIFKNDIDLVFPNKKLQVYESHSKQATYNTIQYVFKQFRRGIFVQIMNNAIKTFVAIDNYESDGFEIMKHVKLDPSKHKSVDDFMKTVNEEHYRRLRFVKRKEESIYFTNCSVNLWDNDTRETEIVTDWIYTYQYHLLVELLKARKINDIEFVLNFKDQTMLMKDGQSSPHFHILGSLTTPLNNKCKNFIPILNLGSHKKFADIPMPTSDDWDIITNKIFLGQCRDSYVNVRSQINEDFDSKIPTAMFRGGATGCGTIIKNNPRLKAAYLTTKYYKHPMYGIDSKNGLYLDARLVSFKVRPKKHYSEKYLTIIDPDTMRLRTTKKLPLSTISNYKYILSIEGNVAQFRLSLELSYNSVILLVKSDYYIWYQPLLKPWTHYVPIKSDLSDLMDKIHWCKTHDSKCKEIAKNARAFYNKYINAESVFDYMECLLSRDL